MNFFETMLLIAVALFVFMGFRETKKRQDRENHEEWLYSSRKCLYSIECEFRRICEKTTKTYFNKYSEQLYHMFHIDEIARERQISSMFDNVEKYREEINALKEEYLNAVYAKSVERERYWKYRVNTLPKQLVDEYEINIKQIADTFLEVGDLMWSNILHIKSE